MRNSLGRLTLRGARAVVASSTPRAAHVNTRTIYATRHLCSTTVLSAEAKRKSEADADNKDADVTATALPGAMPVAEPAVHVLTTDSEIPAADSALPLTAAQTTGALDSEAQESEVGEEPEESDSASSLAVRTPEEMLEYLRRLLSRNATRSALYHFGALFQIKGVPSIDEEVMRLMLPVMGRNSWSITAAETIDLAIERGYSLGNGLMNCGLHAMARAGMTKEVETAIEKMWNLSSECHPNATSYNYLIGAHIYAGSVDNAFEVLNSMKIHLIYPTFATYHALITGCLRRRDPRRAFQTLMAVEKQRFDISAMTVAQVMVSSAGNDDYDHVDQLLTKFEECLPRYGNELHRIAEFRGLYQMKDRNRTSKSDRSAMRGDPKPEIGAISEVLHCAFRGGRVDIASRAWNLMEEHYPELDIPLPFYYCLIGAYAGAGDFAQAIDIVGSMREMGLKPSMKDLEMALIRPLAYNVSIIDEQFYRLCDRKDGKDPDSHSAGPSADDAKQDDDNQKASLDDISTVTFDEQDTAESKVQSSSDAVAQEEEQSSQEGTDARESPTSPARSSLAEAVLSSASSLSSGSIPGRFRPSTVGIEEINCIIGACSASHDLDRAFQTFDEVETRFGLERNIDTYNTLLEGCVQTRRLSGGMRVLQEIENVGLPVSGFTLHLAARLLLRSGQSDEVFRLLKKAHAQKNPVLLQTYQMVLKHFTRGDLLEEAVHLKEQGEAEGHEFKALTGRFDLGTVKRLETASTRGNDAHVSSEHSESSVQDGVENEETFSTEASEETKRE